MKKILISYFVFFLVSSHFKLSFSQDTISLSTEIHTTNEMEKTHFNKKRFIAVTSLQTGMYAGSVAALSHIWYKDYPRTSFHFFDDSREWLQMDKVGHLFTSYYLVKMGCDMFEWSGTEKKRSVWIGAGAGFLYLTAIEILDGFSADWGFSWTDISANVLGSALVIGQKILQNNQTKSHLLKGVGAISLKFSFFPSDYSLYRPTLLGYNFAENLIKDYNGQTYWLSCNISSFLKTESRFPKFLNIAFGYGADGMTGGNDNPPYFDGQGTQIIFHRYRQYYFSLDVDLTKIKTHSKFIKILAETFCFIKIPAPAIEFGKYGMKLHKLFY
ncbi:MAG: DUF2279 domain-containing protein [Bacteroidota bacterium]